VALRKIFPLWSASVVYVINAYLEELLEPVFYSLFSTEFYDWTVSRQGGVLSNSHFKRILNFGSLMNI
jgi:hypothetical protein